MPKWPIRKVKWLITSTVTLHQDRRWAENPSGLSESMNDSLQGSVATHKHRRWAEPKWPIRVPLL